LRADWLRSNQRFGFRRGVDEGLSHAILTQTQSCHPVIINPKVIVQVDWFLGPVLQAGIKKSRPSSKERLTQVFSFSR